MSDLSINSLSFSSPIRKKQRVTVQYRATSDADVPESYIVVATGVLVNINGKLAPSVTITDLDRCKSVTVQVINECQEDGSINFKKEFQTACFVCFGGCYITFKNCYIKLS